MKAITREERNKLPFWEMPARKELNVPLLRKVLEHIEDLALLNSMDEQWDQETWMRIIQDEETREMCGTACCFGGWTCILTGASPIFYKNSILVNGEYDSTQIVTPDMRIANVSDYAQWELGLSSGQAAVLFGGSNSLETIRGYVEALIEGREI